MHIEKNEYIELIREEVVKIPNDRIVIIATGPLTSEKFTKQILELTGEEELYFYDAAAPIVTKESINFNIAFYGDRYEQEKKKDEEIEDWKKRIQSQNANYINLPMSQEEYENFYQELINAEIVNLHEFEKGEIFEGCMPIEVMAKRGIDTLRYGPLKPVGFDDPRTGKRPYAVVQLRQDDKDGIIYNIVGFQTNLKFGEQKRVFSMIPGLENAEFIKYGVMHRNTYINSSKLLDETYNLKKNKNIFFAGQISGVEGYVESISSGLVAGINAVNLLKGKDKISFSEFTMMGALAKYISTESKDFQPMNANFGIIEPLGFRVVPNSVESRHDIIQAVELKSEAGMIAFCKGIQAAAPVDSFATPLPWEMPGYNDKVIMAAGAFIQGSSIELSADGPIRPPYAVYFQGGLTWYHAKLGIMMSVQKMKEAGLLVI